MARSAEHNSRTVQVPKEALDEPPLTICTLGSQELRQSARRISKVDESVRDLARDPNRDAWVREWRGDRAEPQDMKRLNAYLDERARSGARIE